MVGCRARVRENDGVDGTGQGDQWARSRRWPVAYRILGSRTAADKAMDAARTRWDGSVPHGELDADGWRTAMVARACVELLRASPLPPASAPDEAPQPDQGRGSRDSEHAASQDEDEDEGLLSVSLAEALAVVLDTLAPAERVAFVLHDLYGTSYDDIAVILARSPTAARQLAGRARRRVHAPDRTLDADRTVHARVVEALLSAARDQDVEELTWLLHPDAVLLADPAAVAAGAVPVAVGAQAVADAVASAGAATRPAVLDGFAAAIGETSASRDLVLAFTVLDGRVAEVELLAEPDVVASLDLERDSEAP